MGLCALIAGLTVSSVDANPLLLRLFLRTAVRECIREVPKHTLKKTARSRLVQEVSRSAFNGGKAGAQTGKLQSTLTDAAIAGLGAMPAPTRNASDLDEAHRPLPYVRKRVLVRMEPVWSTDKYGRTIQVGERPVYMWKLVPR